MNRIVRLLLRPTSMVTGGAFLLIILAVWIGRYFGLPLPWILVGVLVIIAVYAFVQMIMRMRAARAGQELEKSIQEQGRAQIRGSRPGREAEIEELQTRLLEAIQSLKGSKVGRGKGSSALYVLPWYMIIGPPASGKTTLLEHSGLNFPYLDAARRRSSVRGVGGTRNCDWWFADQAVLIDTAGRYVLPVEADDSAEWVGFLDLLRKYRGRKPINGLIVGISVPDLLEGGEETVEEHANRVRARIDELIKRLGITFPIYVLFTKCDLIRGFVEYFGDLTKPQRAQAFGATLPATGVPADQARATFERESAALADALDDVRARRLGDSADPRARAEVLFFPMQFRAVLPRLARFVEVLFQANPYQEAPLYRGFYFTSGTQEGRPIDSVINAMLRGFGLASTAPGMTVEPSQAKSYFIENVFSRVVFPDRNLAGPSAAGERRRRVQRIRAFSGAAVGLALFALLLMGLSAANRVQLERVRSTSDRVQAATLSAGGLSLADAKSMDELRGRLDLLERRSKPLARVAMLGTYQGGRVESWARLLLLASLRRAAVDPALPVLLSELGRDQGGDFFRSYDRYRTWRILQDPAVGLRTPDDVDRVARTLAAHWSGASGGGSPDEYAASLRGVLDYARRHPAILSEVFPAGRSADPELEAAVRARLRGDWTAEGLLPAVRARAAGVAGVTLASAAGENSGLSGTATVPGAYTAEGWKEARGFLDGLDAVRRDEALRAAFGGEPPDLRSELLARYGDEFVQAWLGFLGGVDVPPSADAAGAQAFLERAAGEGSPILKLLREAARQTDLEGGTGVAPRAVLDAFVPVREFFQAPGKGALSRIRGRLDPDKTAASEYLALLGALKEGYASVAKAPNPAETKEILDLEGWIRTRLPGGDPVEDELARFLQVPVHVVQGTARRGRGRGLQAGWGQVASEFRESLAGRYPCAAGGPDAALRDYESFFGPSGTVWTFYRENLSGVITETGDPLDPTVTISPAFRQAVARAYRIRTALFSGGSAGLSLSVRAGVPRRDAGSSLVPRGTRLEIGGDAIVYQLGAQTWKNIVWPGASPSAGAAVRLSASNATPPPLQAEGVWGFFRLIDRAQIRRTGGNAVMVSWKMNTEMGDVELPYEVGDLPAVHPLESGFLRFSCPEAITTDSP